MDEFGTQARKSSTILLVHATTAISPPLAPCSLLAAIKTSPQVKTVPPFVNAHNFCASRNGPKNSGFFRTVAPNTKMFLCDFIECVTMWEKEIVSRAIET